MSETPVDLDQLNLISDGSEKDRAFLVSVYLKETELDLVRLKDAFEKKNAQELRRLAHGCAGASDSYGMIAIVPVLREIESKALASSFDGIDSKLLEAKRQYDAIVTFLKTLDPS